MYVIRLSENKRGRDFIVGDLHGAHDTLAAALARVQFNAATDRLFMTGDLIDRGARSLDSLQLLAQPWVYSIRGNHEQMFLDLYEEGPVPEEILPFLCSRNGMGWWVDVTPAQREAFLEAWAVLPYAFELETSRGKVGIIHAEVPPQMSWPQFVAALEAQNPEVMKSCLWGRTRVKLGDMSGVAGIDRVYSGHTIHLNVSQYGNVYMLDTGAVQGELKGEGHLSLTSVIAKTSLMTTPVPVEQNAVVRIGETLETPFGVYINGKS